MRRRDFVKGAAALATLAGARDAEALPVSQVLTLLGRVQQAPLYEGLVATRLLAPTSRSTSNKQWMSRAPHHARDNITSLKVALPNWWINSTNPYAETGIGASADITASIEYPVGVFTQLLFSGIATGTVADAATLWSDYVNVTIPNGALFWVRVFYTSAVGIPGWGGGPTYDLSSLGGLGKNAASGLTDQTMGGTISGGNTGSTSVFTPLAIVAQTRNRSFIVMGDSIGLGYLQSSGAGIANDMFGIINPKLGDSYGNAYYGQVGSTALSLTLSNTNRAALLAYASDFVCEYGRNDIQSSNRTVVQVTADLATIYALAPANIKRKYQTTLTPTTSSTDNWVTTGNQTIINATNNGRRTALNDNIRAISITGQTGYFDIADVFETSHNSGIWIATGVRTVTDFAITAAAFTLTSATASFTSADVGSTVAVAGAGAAGAYLVASITAFTNSTTVTLGTAAGTTVSGAAAGGIGLITPDGIHDTFVGGTLLYNSSAIAA